MFRTLLSGLVALTWILASPAMAQTRLFADDKPLQMTITAPFPVLVATAKNSMPRYPGALTVSEGSGPAQTIPIQLRARGLTRRTAGFCLFPPLQLDFDDKDALKGTPFKGQHKLKLVTYCHNQPDYEQRIILEYLVYKLYNVITPMSFRVRGAEVTYRKDANDTGVTRFGYMIEDLSDVAGRNGFKELNYKSRAIGAGQLDAHAAGRAALLEFMIGNLDWDFLAAPVGATCCHNSRFIARSDALPLKAVVPIAYDFDYSGWVDSPYAGPPIGIPIEFVTQRYYRGYCVSTAEMPAVIAEFRAHRAEMTALVADNPRLNAKFRDKTVKYLDGFFTLLDDPARVQKEIINHCR